VLRRRERREYIIPVLRTSNHGVSYNNYMILSFFSSHLVCKKNAK
jgi:hypothetical protein